jgi:peptide/nickel transport system permease protein
MAPGGLATLMDPNLDAADRARLAKNLGLDQPAHIQYLRWLANLSRGSLGRSLTYGRPVAEMVLERLPATILLAGTGLLLTVVAGLVFGTLSALRPHSRTDQLLTFGSFLGLAMPNFWFGIMLIIVFSVLLRWLPASGMMTPQASFSLADRARYLIMPTLVLALTHVAQIMRYTRSSVLGVLRMEYVTVSRAKGLSEFVVQTRHVLRNALIPVVTVLGLSLPRLFGGAAVVEALFGWPGMGQLGVDAALRRDTPLILGVTMMISAAVVASNLLVDLLYPYLDPRVRRQ